MCWVGMITHSNSRHMHVDTQRLHSTECSFDWVLKTMIGKGNYCNSKYWKVKDTYHSSVKPPRGIVTLTSHTLPSITLTSAEPGSSLVITTVGWRPGIPVTGVGGGCTTHCLTNLTTSSILYYSSNFFHIIATAVIWEWGLTTTSIAGIYKYSTLQFLSLK